jgi:hypothetical protein
VLNLPTRFSFKGLALAAAGQITSPFFDTIEVQASSALPEIGGYGSAKAVDFRYRDLIRFDVAHTHVIGSSINCCDNGPSFTTLLQASVEGLDVMGMVTADRVVSRLMTTYSEGATEPSVKVIGTRFENLKIAGIPVEVDLAVDLLDRYHKFNDLSQAYEKGEKDLRDLFAGANKISRASMVRGLKPASAGLDYSGHIVQVPGLGAVRLAEIRITPLTRIVSMIQIDFDCPFQGKVMFCMSEDGGSPS